MPSDFKRLSVSTWKEQQHLNYKYSANLTPEGRLAYLRELNDKAYGIKKDKRVIDKKISFGSGMDSFHYKFIEVLSKNI